MNSVFKLCKREKCSITITGLEEENEEYLFDSTIISTRAYTYDQSVTLNALYTLSSKEEETLINTAINIHKENAIDESTFKMPIDGTYKVAHIIVPTEEWLDYVLKRDPSALDVYSSVYFYSFKLNSFAKYNKKLEQITAADINELLEINACPPQDVGDLTTTIIKEEKITFNLCYIQECYYLLCKNLFNVLLERCAVNKTNKMDIFNRDFIWMSINIIKYLLEKGQYFEAQRILEKITNCGTICRQVLKENKIISDCGCGNQNQSYRTI